MRRVLRFVPMLLIFSWIGWGMVPRSLPRPEVLDALPVPVEASFEGQTPEAILERMRAAYASVAAYRDEGWARNVHIEGDERKVWSVEQFRVVVSSPDRLVWQWRELKRHRRSEGEFVNLLQRGDEVRFHSTRWSRENLGTRAEAFTSLSSLVSNDLLRLLFPGELSGRNKSDLFADVRVVGIERFDEHACFRVEGSLSVQPESEPTHYALWIDCESHLLRRSTERIHFGDWILESLLVFSPRAGGAVSEQELELDESF